MPRYVGRVGGLAVALGVGAAVAATPGVAWAGPSDSGSSSSSTDSPSSAGSSSSSSSGSSAGSPGSTPSSASSGEDQASGGDSDGAAGVAESNGSDTSKTDKKSATVKDKKSGSDAADAADAVVTHKRPKRSVTRTESDSNTAKGVPTADHTTAEQAKSEPAAAPAVSEASVVEVANQLTPTASTVHNVPQVVSVPGSAVRPLVSSLLSSVGLAPWADGDFPEVPGDSPLTLAGLAAFRRHSQQALRGDEAPALKVADRLVAGPGDRWIRRWAGWAVRTSAVPHPLRQRHRARPRWLSRRR